MTCSCVEAAVAAQAEGGWRCSRVGRTRHARSRAPLVCDGVVTAGDPSLRCTSQRAVHVPRPHPCGLASPCGRRAAPAWQRLILQYTGSTTAAAALGQQLLLPERSALAYVAALPLAFCIRCSLLGIYYRCCFLWQ